VTRPPVTTVIDEMSCFTPFEDFEVLLLEIRMKLPFSCAR